MAKKKWYQTQVPASPAGAPAATIDEPEPSEATADETEIDVAEAEEAPEPIPLGYVALRHPDPAVCSVPDADGQQVDSDSSGVFLFLKDHANFLKRALRMFEA